MWGSTINENYWWHQCITCHRVLSIQERRPNYRHISMELELDNNNRTNRKRSYRSVLNTHHCKDDKYSAVTKKKKVQLAYEKK